jgi:hypothetical protein
MYQQENLQYRRWCMHNYTYCIAAVVQFHSSLHATQASVKLLSGQSVWGTVHIMQVVVVGRWLGPDSCCGAGSRPFILISMLGTLTHTCTCVKRTREVCAQGGQVCVKCEL